MSNNPNVVVLMNEEISVTKIVDNIKKDWNEECVFEKEDQEKFTTYQFEYNNIEFALAVFNSKFPEDMESEINISHYSQQAEKVIENHTNFCVLSIIGDDDEDINMRYVSFTRVVMSLLLSLASEQCIVYDMRSRQLIDKEIYLKMYQNMKVWYKEDEEIFPTDWYINYVIYENEDGFNAITLGFEAFNDYEIEIRNGELKPENILEIMRYIVINVISRYDQIKNGDMIPVPIGGNYEDAIVKKSDSKVLDQETLTIIF